jgi:hypothetical protein
MQPWQRTLHYSVLSTLGVLIGWPLGYILIGGSLEQFVNARGLIASAVLFSILIALGLQMHWSARQRQLDAEKRAAEAQLRLRPAPTARLSAARTAAAQVHPRQRRRDHAPGRRARRAVLPGQREVHLRAHRARRTPHPHRSRSWHSSSTPTRSGRCIARP